MNFNLANHYAEEINQGQEEMYQQLVSLCIPYFLYIRKKFGFPSISVEQVKKELAFDAVTDALIVKQNRSLPLGLCLQNSFRDVCRKRIRITREHDTGKIMEQCNIKIPGSLLGASSPEPLPPDKAENNEIVELTKNILEDHDPFSKKVVFQKTRGSTYPDMASIFSTTSNECKRVYWHDVYHLREKLNPNPEED